MRIAYLLAENVYSHPGLYRKVLGQVSQWRSAGHECFFVLHGVGQTINQNGEICLHDASLMARKGPVTKRDRLWRLRRQYQFIEQSISYVRPDITYSRYMFPFPGRARALLDAGKVVVEVNSDDRSEYFTKNLSTGIYNYFFRGRVFNGADGLVFVTAELAESKSFHGFTSRREIIANGIDVTDCQFVEDPGNKFPQICFIGSPSQIWHGLDKLRLIAAALPEATLHILGPDKDECVNLWQSCPPNVQFHGYLDGPASAEIVSHMDLGISTLALHRKNMNEACPLKMRQYFAHGLPVIAGHPDPDVDANSGFVLQLPNTEENVSRHLPEIVHFVYHAFRDVALRQAIRNHASSYMSESHKETMRLRFFERLLQDMP